jgi:hypothetical protein
MNPETWIKIKKRMNSAVRKAVHPNMMSPSGA